MTVTREFQLVFAAVAALAACGTPTTGPDDDGNGTLPDNFSISFEQRDASGWFGGDDRPGSQRTVGIAQSVLVTDAIELRSFSFYFTSPFNSAQNGGAGHAVTVILNVRSANGTILKTASANVASSFTGDWVTWTGLDLDVAANTTLIFSAYVQGAFAANQYSSGYGAHQAAGYAGGSHWIKDGTSDADLESWAGWGDHSWDANFRLSGRRAGT